MKRTTYEAARLPAQQRAASEAAKWADSMEVSGPRVILDTETTGIGPRDELVEIAIVDADSGQTLYTAPIMPGGRKPEEAAAVHGLNRDRLGRMDARRWPAHHETVSSILARVSRVLSYNAEFDRRLIRQTARRYGLTLPDSNWECIMLDYARGGRWIRLSEACNREGIAVTGHHRALADARMARELLLRMEAGGVPAQPGSPTAEWNGDEGEIDGLGGGLIAAAALWPWGRLRSAGAVRGAFASVARSARDTRVLVRRGSFPQFLEGLGRSTWCRPRQSGAPRLAVADQEEMPPLAPPAVIAIMSSLA